MKLLEAHSQSERDVKAVPGRCVFEPNARAHVTFVVRVCVCVQMSFVRVGRPPQRNKGLKKSARPKKEWVVSVLAATSA